MNRQDFINGRGRPLKRGYDCIGGENVSDFIEKADKLIYGR